MFLSVDFFCELHYNIFMTICNLCPQNCGVDRNKTTGFCRVGNTLKIARVGLHFFEEPCISAQNGSGTIFFSGCNLRCCYCQNHVISSGKVGVEVSFEDFEKILLEVDQSQALNVNLVSPSQYSEQIARVLEKVKHKLTKPIIYNTNAFEKVEKIKRLDGLVDVYLPDLKYFSDDLAQKYSNCKNYFEMASLAIKEMRKQQPVDVFDENGVIQKGVIVRHLVLLGYVDDSKRVLDFLAQFDKTLFVSLMSQYFVAQQTPFANLNRRLTKREYRNVIDYFFAVGLKNGFSQELSSAVEEYVPCFDEEQMLDYLKKLEKE